jgi:hypothetical protein
MYNDKNIDGVCYPTVIFKIARIWLHLHQNNAVIMTQLSIHFNTLSCFAVRSEPESNPRKNEAALQESRSVYFAGNFSWILSWIQIRFHSTCLKGQCHDIFSPYFPRGWICFFKGRIQMHPVKMNRICQTVAPQH